MTTSFVYVIRYAANLYKIGISDDPDRRLRELRCTDWLDLRLVKTWRRPNGDAGRVETEAHRLLRLHRSSCLGARERFVVTAKAACVAVKLAIELLSASEPEDERLPMLSDADLSGLGHVPVVHSYLGYIRLAGGEDPSGAVACLRARGVGRDGLFIEGLKGFHAGADLMVKAIREGDVVFAVRASDLPRELADVIRARGASLQVVA